MKQSDLNCPNSFCFFPPFFKVSSFSLVHIISLHMSALLENNKAKQETSKELEIAERYSHFIC